MRDLLFVATMCLAYVATIFRPFAGVLTWSWISFANPHRMLWDEQVGDFSWALVTFLAILIGLLCRKEPRRFFMTPIMWLVCFFVVGISITSLFALAPGNEVYDKYSLVVKTFLFLIITGMLLDDRRRFFGLIEIMVLSLGYYGVKGGIFALKTGGQYTVFGPAESMIADNNHLAAALLVALPLMNFLRIWAAQRWVRIAVGATMGLSLLSILASYSRGALIGLVAVAIFALLRSRRKVLLGAAMVVAIVSAVSIMPEKWHTRMHTISSYNTDDSAEGRIKIWKASFWIAAARPLVGGGFRAPYIQKIVSEYSPGTIARAVHSIYFEVIGEHGFIVFLVWLAMPITGLLSARNIIRRAARREDLAWANDLARMSQVSIVAYLVAGAFLSLSYWDYIFTLIVLLGSLSRFVKMQPDVPPRHIAAQRPATMKRI